MAAWVVPAIIVAGTLLSTYMQKEASERATDAQLAAADKAASAQLQMFYQMREDLEPWMEAGKWALQQLVGWTKYESEKPKEKDFTKTGTETRTREERRWDPHSETYTRQPVPYEAETEVFDEEAYNKAVADWEATGVYQPGLIEQGPGEFVGSPGYEFRFGEGVKALERGASARGGVLSGRTQKALVEYGQQFATSEYDKFLNRYYQSLNPLMATAGMAPLGAQGQGAMQTGGNLANIYLGAGQSQAAGYINRANIYGNTLQQGTNLAAQYYMWNRAGMFDQDPNQALMTA